MSNSIGEVRTSGRLDCDAQRAWQKVCFYEHIARKPSWLLRTVLPTPERTTGSYQRVGDISRCMYSDGGYLAKQISRIVTDKRIEFDVIEQTIRYASRIVLHGGTIEIESHSDGTSSVHMITRYELRFPSFVVGRLFVKGIVSAMHRIVIRDMQERLRPCLDRTHAKTPGWL